MLLYSIMLGTISGVISGLIPGVGNFVLLLILYPFLGSLSVVELLVFYATMSTICQYIGSIPATIYGIPGESSSYPTVIESAKLTSIKQVGDAISGSAFGSFFGSILVLAACYLLSDYAGLISYFYSTKILVSLLLAVSIIICFNSGNNILTSFLLILTGLFLGAIGFNTYYSVPILTFDNMYLFGGLPTEVVLITLFAIPQILQNYNINTIIDKSNLSYSISKVYLISPLYTCFYTIIGFIGGLVPGLTTIFSSIAAYTISSWITKDPVKRIVASETANNAGAFSLLLPLLLFGIPILSSEALLLSLIEQKGFILSFFNFSTLITDLSYNLVFANLIGLLLAWPLSKQVRHFYKIDLNTIFTIIIILLVAVVLYSGYINYSLVYYTTVFILLAPVGYLLRNLNTLPLIFAFIIHDKLFDGVFRLIQLS